jgi:hypothetical protein
VAREAEWKAHKASNFEELNWRVLSDPRGGWKKTFLLVWQVLVIGLLWLLWWKLAVLLGLTFLRNL